jgi:single-stranded-DNA-specific exonuclease
MSEKLADALRQFSERLSFTVENGNEVAILTHLDADGITSGSILAIALSRMGARYSIRTISEMNPHVIEIMKAEGRDFYAITDVGAGWVSYLKKAFGDKWVIIDHHQISEEEILTDDQAQILNPWKYGIDGGTEVPSGGMAYMAAITLNPKNRDLSALSVVSAIGDRQDQGDKKSLIGLNSEILKTAQSLGLLTVDLDVMLSGRETRPLHEALAYTSFPYIEGLTWNPEACYALFKSASIRLKESSGRWRVLAEFSVEEKSTIVQAVANFVATPNKNRPTILQEDLIGHVYTLAREEKRSHLRDARDFSTMLNACGSLRSAGLGIAICMGDRNTTLNAAEQIIITYMTTLRNYVTSILTEKWRIVDDGKTVFLNGDGLLREDMLGVLSSLLSSSSLFRDKIIFIRTLTSEGTHRFSSRKSLGCISQVNLALVMRRCADAFQGKGGGHSAAAEATIPSSVLEDFIARIKAAINDPKYLKES